MSIDANAKERHGGEMKLGYHNDVKNHEIENAGRGVITLDLNDPRPLYMQIVESILRLIENNRLKLGDSLPSSRKLSGELGINYHTVNRAYEILIHDGILQIDRKKRITIARGISESAIGRIGMWKMKIWGMIEEMISAGFSKTDILMVLSSLIGDVAEGYN